MNEQDEHVWVMPHVLNPGRVTLVSGPRFIGKSTWAIATTARFISLGGRALYVATGDRANVTGKAAHAAGIPTRENHRGGAMFVTRGDDVTLPHHAEAIVGHTVDAAHGRLLIVDTFPYLCGGGIHRGMSEAVEALKKAAQARGVSVILINHHAYDTGESYGADTHLRIVEDPWSPYRRDYWKAADAHGVHSDPHKDRRRIITDLTAGTAGVPFTIHPTQVDEQPGNEYATAYAWGI